MLHSVDIRKWTVAGLLILHIIWIGNHMRLVANDQINPWRLGGYAMYTVPSPAVRFQVYDPNFLDMPIPVNLLRYDAAIRFTNAGRTFRCVPVSSAALRGFFEENGNLIGKNLAFVYSERRFYRDPRAIKREMQGVVEVIWQDAQSFTYISRFCGTEVTESAILS